MSDPFLPELSCWSDEALQAWVLVQAALSNMRNLEDKYPRPSSLED